jgi:uncharacterized protein
MIFKLIAFGLLGLVAYKFIAGRLSRLTGGDSESIDKKEQEKIEEDTLMECDKCGTFVTYKESIIYKGKVYCSKECAGL